MMNDELMRLMGTILRIDITELGLPLYGKLIEVTPFWITIERRDRSTRIISKARIIGIEPVRDQPC